MTSQTKLVEEFQGIEDRFNAAMVSNDPAEIGQCITTDWVLVNPESGPVSREMILGIIGSGMLTHSSMSKQIVRAKQYGDVVVVTGRAQNTGTFQGTPIEADEWVTDIYVRAEDGWRCTLTQLTPALNPGN